MKHSVDNTQALLRRELEIRKGELEEQLFFNSLERIFIEERIYKEQKFETSKTMDEVVAFVDSKLEPFKKDFIREVKREDILRLLEIKMQRILKFNKDKADELIQKIEAEIGPQRNGACNHRMVQAFEGKVRQGLPTPNGDKEFRYHCRSKGSRRQREAIHRPKGRLHRHRLEESRVRSELFRP